MSNNDDAPKPKFVGVAPGPDDVVSDYAKGVAARAAKRRESQDGPKIPNLAQAQAQYDPSKDQRMTLDQIAKAQDGIKAVLGESTEKPQLRQETIAGLAGIKAYADRENKKMSDNRPPNDANDEVQPDEAPPRPLTKAEAEDVVSNLDDMDLELLMERVRSDIINNESQRKLIDSLVDPIDLTDGLSIGEFSQLVPIRKGQFEVKFRTVSQIENDNFRRILFNQASEDARVAQLATERYGLMQTVAAVVRIQGKEFPKHLTRDGNGTASFNEEIFMNKYALISSYPSPLIHALGTHAYWFDLRVRKLFTIASLKNG